MSTDLARERAEAPKAEALTDEARIRWRRQLMSVPGGVAWLAHAAKLYSYNEHLLGAHHIGLPDDVARALLAVRA